MLIEILGSGGAAPIPKAFCICEICQQARAHKGRYKRTGPAVFIHDNEGSGILFDTSEDISFQLERSNITHVSSCFYSHSHQDHTAGSRIFEMWKGKRQNLSLPTNFTDLFIPEKVFETFKRDYGLYERVSYLEKLGAVKNHILREYAKVELKLGTAFLEIAPFNLAHKEAVGFNIQNYEVNRKILVIMDEIKGWLPSSAELEADVVIMPMCAFEFNPFTNERIIPTEHTILKRQQNFEEMIQTFEALKAKKIVLIHIEEENQFSYDDYVELEKTLTKHNVTISYDTYKLQVI